jgi:uncharacterized protein (TIGR00661 family)
MAGEGRGHAARAQAIVERLRADHRVDLFAPDDAYDLLEPCCRETEVVVHRLPGLGFRYRRDHSVDFLRTALAAGGYISRLEELVGRLAARLERLQPDLVITDFEPALPRAARRAGIPYLCLDHQHFLRANDLAGLPLKLRARAFLMGWVVGLYYGGQRRTILSSFYNPPLKRRYRDKVVQVGVLLRPEMREIEPRRGGHLVAYLRKFCPPSLLEALAGCGLRVHIYGLKEKIDRGGLVSRPLGRRAFLEDLSSCAALVSTAGNQLLGEAQYFRKPALVFPERRNFEQYINAHFLARSGAGEWHEPYRITPDVIRGFLARLDDYRAAIDPEKVDGTERALAVIESELAALGAGAPRRELLAS